MSGLVGPDPTWAATLSVAAGVLVLSYLIGSIPWAYILVRAITGEDITEHGTGNVGAMNVKRATGSWAWFTVDMVLDAFKGFVPALTAKMLIVGVSLTAWTVPYSRMLSMLGPFVKGMPALAPILLAPMLAVSGAVLGHNYSLWLGILKRRYVRTGKGLATGGGALLAYDWRYFLVVVTVGLLTIAITRYMLAGQVAAALSLPVFAVVTRQPDWPFAVAMGAVVYAAHHKRFVGLLRGREPKLYTRDRMGPRG